MGGLDRANPPPGWGLPARQWESPEAPLQGVRLRAQLLGLEAQRDEVRPQIFASYRAFAPQFIRRTVFNSQGAPHVHSMIATPQESISRRRLGSHVRSHALQYLEEGILILLGFRVEPIRFAISGHVTHFAVPCLPVPDRRARPASHRPSPDTDKCPVR